MDLGQLGLSGVNMADSQDGPSGSKKKRKSGKFCAVQHCSNTPGHGVSLHSFPDASKGPQYAATRQLWVKWVTTTRDGRSFDSTSKHIYVCSEHFTRDDFSNIVAVEMGFSTKKLLKDFVVPSVRPTPPQQQTPTPNTSTPGIRKRKSVTQKLEANRVVQEYQHQQQQEIDQQRDKEAAEVMLMLDSGLPTEERDSKLSDPYDSGDAEMPHEDTEILSQDLRLPSSLKPKSSTREIGTQKSFKSYYYRSSGTQTDKEESSLLPPPITINMKDCSVTCDLVPLPPLQLLGSTSTQTWPEEEEEIETGDNCEEDADYMPCQESEDEFAEEAEEQPTETTWSGTKDVPWKERKFLVVESSLMELFQFCHHCLATATCGVKKIHGTLLIIWQKCPSCGYQRTWSNQPYVGRMPVLNLQMSGAILVTGSTAAKALRMFSVMGIAAISKSSYYRHTANYVQPAILKKWETHQAELVQILKNMEGGCEGSLDGQCDSPGRCAGICHVSYLEGRINKIIAVTFVKSTEVASSAHMEHEGLVRLVEWFEQQNLDIHILISDRHKQNMKYIRENLPWVLHYIDIWHVDKGLKKKILALSKTKDCEELAAWIKAVSAHMYYVASSTPNGDGDMMKAKWKMLPLHMQNIHRDASNTLHPKCGHGRLNRRRRNKLWLTPGSKAAVKMEELLTKPTLLKDISMLSPKYQTSSLEAKHSLNIQFAPKNTYFSYNGMKARIHLASLHYNENSERMQAVTRDGKPRFTLCFPKSKRGKHTVRAVKTKATYNYATDIIHLMFTSYQDNPRTLRDFMATQPAPPPSLCATAERPDKQEAIEQFQTRYQKNSLVY